MAKTQILEYTIHLRDAALVAQLQAQLAAGQGPGKMIVHPGGTRWGILRAPNGAAEEFAGMAGAFPPALPILFPGQTPPTTGAGYLTSGWFSANSSLPRNVAKFRKSTGWWIFGSETVFYWSGSFALAPSTTFDGTPGSTFPIAPRLFLYGYEQLSSGEMGRFTGAGAMQARSTSAAARTGDGLGARVMSTANGQAAGRIDVSLADLRPAVTDVTELWLRLYVRPRRFPSGTVPSFILLTDGAGVDTGLEVGLTAGGQLALFKQGGSPGYVRTLVTTVGQLTLDAWARLDLVWHAGPTLLSLDVTINGAFVGSGDAVFTSRPGRVCNGLAIGLGTSVLAVATDLELDIDDVVAARGPADPADFAQGSHLVRVAPDGFGPAHDPSWVGPVHLLRNRYKAMSGTADHLTSDTPDAVAEVTLPLDTVGGPHPYSLGVGAWQVVAMSDRSAALSGQLGYQVGSASPVMTPMVEGGSVDYDTMCGSPAEGPLPAGTALRLRYQSASDTAASGAQLSSLCAVVELRGSFGPEDVPPDAAALAFPARTPAHLAEHPSTPWARDVLPLGPVIRVGGTYVGTGGAVALPFPLPVAWLLIRNTSVVGSTTYRWWPPLVATHVGATGTLQDNVPPLHHVRDFTYVPAGPDADQQMAFRVEVAAALSRVGETYQYCALLDPAGRFARAATVAVRGAGTTGDPGPPRTWPLDDPAFLAEASFQYLECVVESGQFTNDPGLTWKTPGHDPTAVSTLTGGASTLLPTALAFGTGTVGVHGGLAPHDKVEQVGLLLFRQDDGNPASAGQVLFYGSYVGDGEAARAVQVGTIGRRLLYLCVGPSSGATPGHHRDPSHTTTTSTLVTGGGGVPTTAITGGDIDTFLVGPTLNALDETFHYWGLYGGTAACHNGWSCNGEFPIPSDSPKPPGWDEPTEDDPPDGPGTDPGDDPGDPGSDIFAECVEASTRIVNLALSEIGITKAITSLGATTDVPPQWIDTSQEAYAARMIYRTLVDTVLRDDEWAFTREYATLTALAGSREAPVNPDWTYSYTLPADCLRVKRICVPVEQRRYSTQPVPFDRRSADLGQTDILLTNEPGGGLLPPAKVGEPVTVTIEYAKRISCPARVTDSQFRECLMFRLAAGLAKALSRDAGDADRCLRNYMAARPRGLTQQSNDQEPQRPTGGLPDWTTGR